MSNIPKNRKHLNELIERHFGKLLVELDDLSAADAKLMCDDEFSIKDILAVRLWWSNAVMDWVKAGQKGKVPVTPAEGYSWRETPALNAATAKQCRQQSYADIKKKLIAAQKKVLKLIGSLSDKELTKPGVYEWAGKWPIMRWISVGTSSQYDGARKLIRKAKKNR